MQRLVFLLLIFLIVSCSQENPGQENLQAAPDMEGRIWHQTDTLMSSGKWTSDSIRQINLTLNYSSEVLLEVKSDAPVYLFYGDRLIKKSSDGYLQHSFNSNINENIFLSLDKNVRVMSYGVYSLKRVNGNGAYLSLENSERESRWILDNILVILLLGASLIMVIVKINYDKRYFNILSFNKVFTTRLNDGDHSRMRIMDQDNIVFAGLYAFITAGLLYFLSLGKNINFLGIEPNGFIEYLKILSIVAIGLIAKVILVAVASNLFGNNKISAFYVKEMLNINTFFVIILFFSSILIFLFKGAIPTFWLSIAIYAMLACYVIRLILLYFKILKLSSFSNLYLFSYFCTTEIFPFLIGLKYFIR